VTDTRYALLTPQEEFDHGLIYEQLKKEGLSEPMAMMHSWAWMQDHYPRLEDFIGPMRSEG
jgi:hypothetical protein